MPTATLSPKTNKPISSEVIAALKAQVVFDDAGIITAGDHGQEFNQAAVNDGGTTVTFRVIRSRCPR